jgi:hypothetical protein
MKHPIITLTSDFGEDGYYPGAMRGVLISLCPEAQLVDITHQITPFAPLEASFILEQATRTFPPGTVHLAVVDPGVGGMRKSIFLRHGESWFVGPDNGIFTPFVAQADAVYRIREDEVALPGRSRTFDGRDLFAPAAARLARGDDPEVLGERTAQIARLHIPRPRREGTSLVGQVLYHDHFGNLITNIRALDLQPFGDQMEVWVGTYRMRSLSGTYDEASLGETIALVGSSGHLEVAVSQGNAAAHLGVGKGERVRVLAPSLS